MAAHDEILYCAQFLATYLGEDLLICVLELTPHESYAPCFALLDDFVDLLQPFLVFEQLFVVIWLVIFFELFLSLLTTDLSSA